MEIQTDVLVIGASMAGSCLARQLKLKHPELDITLIDKKTEFDYWVGESTLESFWDYAVRHLNLTRYLDTKHLYKHGLRFYFDSPEHDLSLSEMSEMGRSWFHAMPAHQLDRKRFDTDLCEMNKQIGINVHLGCAANNIHIDADNRHVVTTRDKKTFRCKYLIDAAGFATPLGKKFDLIESVNERHPVSSYWGRFSNTADMDQLGGMEWREKVNHTSRFLATTHFMYKGYWIWLIPIDAETVSIGVTIKNDMVDIKIKNKEGFVDFLTSHKAMSQIITSHSELLDYHAMRNLARQSKQNYSTDRWFLTGMSAAFMDPMLSPGSAYLSDANRMIGDLIATDMAGKEQEFKDKTIAYNAFSKFWFENFLLHISGNYSGSYDLHRVLFESLLMHWFGMILPTSMSENWGYDPSMQGITEDQLRQKAQNMLQNSAIKKIHAIKDELASYLEEKGILLSNNKGKFYDIEIGKRRMRHTLTAGKHLCEMEIESVEKEMIEVSYYLSIMRISEAEGLTVSAEDIKRIATTIADNNFSLQHSIKLLKETSTSTKAVMKHATVA